MEGLSDVLAEIDAVGLVLSAEGNELVLRAHRAKAVLTPELKKSLTEHKAELLALLGQRQLHDRFEVVLADALAKEAEIVKSYKTKATVPADVPPYPRVLAEQEWLASIDWRIGLRCGLSGLQCRVCKGIPCKGSNEWEQA